MNLKKSLKIPVYVDLHSLFMDFSKDGKRTFKTKQDFDIFAKYAPPANFIDCEMLKRAKKAVGDKGLVNITIHAAFNILNQFRKLEDMMMDPVMRR